LSERKKMEGKNLGVLIKPDWKQNFGKKKEMGFGHKRENNPLTAWVTSRGWKISKGGHGAAGTIKMGKRKATHKSFQTGGKRHFRKKRQEKVNHKTRRGGVFNYTTKDQSA